MRARALAFALVLVLLAGACSDDEATRPIIEKDDLIEKADAVCKAAAADVASLASGQDEAATSPDKARALLVEKLLPRLDKELGDLKELGEPQTSRVDWDALIKSLDTAVTSIKQQAQDDPVKALTTSSAAFADANTRAAAFGLKECGKT
jgi:hypothetical protein